MSGEIDPVYSTVAQSCKPQQQIQPATKANKEPTKAKIKNQQKQIKNQQKQMNDQQQKQMRSWKNSIFQ